MPKTLLDKIHLYLLCHEQTIAVAESCSAGQLANQLTKLSGSSAYFLLGVVAYSNACKEKVLKIPHQIIAKNGAVSQVVALKMAEMVRKLAKTDFGIGITGIAGPTGATYGKPVGTVFIALARKNKIICQKFVFQGNRLEIRKKAADKSLELLYAFLHRH